MKKKVIKFIQNQLNAMGKDAGPEDGIMGPKTMNALNQIEDIPSQWSKTRKAVGFIQLLARQKGIDSGKIDGYWGPQTEFAFESLEQVIVEKTEPVIWRPEEIMDQNPNKWPSQVPESNLVKSYGPVGENQTRISLPYPHKLAWQTSRIVHSYLCHEKVHNSLARVLSHVYDHYGLKEIQRLRLDLWGGCLNVRKKRGGSTYSLHSWGIAI
ncbi:MAG: peptidoglycan-binding protein, partial [Desulfobacteraceae bacterium]|nr:peptidoglycan-binding protein [Desulfobacteraceae bacterium]